MAGSTGTRHAMHAVSCTDILLGVPIGELHTAVGQPVQHVCQTHSNTDGRQHYSSIVSESLRYVVAYTTLLL